MLKSIFDVTYISRPFYTILITNKYNHLVRINYIQNPPPCQKYLLTSMTKRHTFIIYKLFQYNFHYADRFKTIKQTFTL